LTSHDPWKSKSRVSRHQGLCGVHGMDGGAWVVGGWVMSRVVTRAYVVTVDS
jgi:hypothetical protein